VLKLDWTTSEKSYPAFLSLNHKRRKKFQELDNYKIACKCPRYCFVRKKVACFKLEKKETRKNVDSKVGWMSQVLCTIKILQGVMSHFQQRVIGI
jgi:hypothetical protein